MSARKFIWGTMAMVAGISFGSLQVQAADHTLTISTWAPPGHAVNKGIWPKLIELIEEATDGKVTAELKYNIASPPAQYDLIVDGAADFSWIYMGYTPGRFVGGKIIELPGYQGDAEAASVAFWHVHEKYLVAANEYSDVKLVGLMTHGPGQVHTSREVSTLAGIDGLKLRFGGGVAGAVGTALGASGIRVPAPKVYETLASNAADGVMIDIGSRVGLKLTEVAPYVYEMPGGFYRGAFALIMNQEKFDSLPADIQEQLNGTFGEDFSRAAGAVWATSDIESRAVTLAASGNKITTASSADQAAYAEVTGGVVAEVLAELAAKGVDAKAAREMIMNEMNGN